MTRRAAVTDHDGQPAEPDLKLVVHVEAMVEVDAVRWAELTGLTTLADIRADIRAYAIERLLSARRLRRAGAELHWWC